MPIAGRARPPTLACDALGVCLTVRAVEGEEQIGRPYRFAIDFVASDPAIDCDAALGAEATLLLGTSPRHGVVGELEQGDEDEAGYRYRAVLVPRAASHAEARASRVWHGQRVPEIVMALLAQSGVAPHDVELRLARAYEPRTRVVELEESPLGFAARLCEDAGIALLYEHAPLRAKVVLVDHPEGFVRASCAELVYRGARDAGALAADAATSAAPSVLSLTYRRRQAPRSIALFAPEHVDDVHVPGAEAPIDARGSGPTGSFDEWFAHKTAAERAALARDRAEELACRVHSYALVTDEPALGAGLRCAVRGHFRRTLDGELLIERVHHHYAAGRYTNEVHALRAGAPYRPARVTPRPRVPGVMPARIERALGPDGGEALEVVLPFDAAGESSAAADAELLALLPEGARRPGPALWSAVAGDPDAARIVALLPRWGSRPLRIEHGAAGLVGAQALAGDELVSTVAGTWVRIHVPFDGGSSYVRYGASIAGDAGELDFGAGERREIDLADRREPAGLFELTDGDYSAHTAGDSETRVDGDWALSVGERRELVGGDSSELYAGSSLHATAGLSAAIDAAGVVDFLVGARISMRLTPLDAALIVAPLRYEWTFGNALRFAKHLRTQTTKKVRLMVPSALAYGKYQGAKAQHVALTAGALGLSAGALLSASGYAADAREAVITGAVVSALGAQVGAALLARAVSVDMALGAMVEVTDEDAGFGVGGAAVTLSDRPSVHLGAARTFLGDYAGFKNWTVQTTKVTLDGDVEIGGLLDAKVAKPAQATAGAPPPAPKPEPTDPVAVKPL